MSTRHRYYSLHLWKHSHPIWQKRSDFTGNFFYQSPLGQLEITEDGNHLHKLVCSTASSHRDSKGETLLQSPLRKEIISQLDGYFNGTCQGFHLPYLLHGTDFQLEVWNTLRAIPYGNTWSYQKLAEEIGNPKAVRAVGSANGKNPLLLILPCHRVIGKSGHLGGYVAGLSRKQYLLDLESGKSPTFLWFIFSAISSEFPLIIWPFIIYGRFNRYCKKGK